MSRMVSPGVYVYDSFDEPSTTFSIENLRWVWTAVTTDSKRVWFTQVVNVVYRVNDIKIATAIMTKEHAIVLTLQDRLSEVFIDPIITPT